METNCKNCGGTIKHEIDKKRFICPYCGTEYHLDNLGRIEEYKVDIEIFGETKKFYISSANMGESVVYSDTYRDINGNFKINKVKPKIKLTLIEI